MNEWKNCKTLKENVGISQKMLTKLGVKYGKSVENFH